MQTRVVGDGGGDTRGVSTVIAVTLMVAMTVLLASVAAVFLVGMGGGMDDPRPKFVSTTAYDDDLDRNGQYLNITHESGATIDTDRLRLVVEGARSVDGSGGSATAATLTEETHIADQVGSEFTATETIAISRQNFTAGGSPVSSKYVDLDDAVVRIVWEDETAQQSAVLYTCRPATPDCQESST